MKRAVRSELVKLTTVQLPLVLLATGTVLTAGLALLTAADAGGSGAMAAKSLSTASGLTSVIGSSFLAMTMVFGVTVSTNEFRHSTATVTYLAIPSRSKVLAGKLVAGFCFGLLFGLLGAAVSTGIGMAFSSAKGTTCRSPRSRSSATAWAPCSAPACSAPSVWPWERW